MSQLFLVAVKVCVRLAEAGDFVMIFAGPEVLLRLFQQLLHREVFIVDAGTIYLEAAYVEKTIDKLFGKVRFIEKKLRKTAHGC